MKMKQNNFTLLLKNLSVTFESICLLPDIDFLNAAGGSNERLSHYFFTVLASIIGSIGIYSFWHSGGWFIEDLY